MEEFEEGDDLLKSFKTFGNDLSVEIGTLDDGMTSDETLVQISQKKEFILNQFLDLMKKVSVDCTYNREDNVRSNNSLEKLSCYPTDSTFNLQDSPYIYEIANDDIISESSDVSGNQSKIVKYKRLVIPFNIGKNTSESYRLKFILVLPDNISGFANTPDNTLIYDYYIYNGLNPNKPKLKGQLVEVGIIENKGKPIPKFKSSFIQQFKIYKEIEQIISTIEDYESSNKKEFNNNILKIYYANNVKTWKCISCQKSYPNSVDACDKPGCQGITKDLSIQHMNSTNTNNSSESRKSLKVIKKRRRRRKK